MPDPTDHPGPRRPALPPLLARVLLNAGIPLVLYLVLQPVVGDVAALAIGAAVPAVVTGVELAWRRRLDPVGAVALLGFVVVLLVFALTGGDPLIVKLHDAVLTGPFGVILLVSAAVRRPLLVVAWPLLRRGHPAPPRRVLAAATVLAGAVMTLHAALILVLALALPTAVFLAVARPIGWAVIALGVLIGWVHRSRLRSPVGRRPPLERPGQDSNLRPRD